MTSAAECIRYDEQYGHWEALGVGGQEREWLGFFPSREEAEIAAAEWAPPQKKTAPVSPRKRRKTKRAKTIEHIDGHCRIAIAPGHYALFDADDEQRVSEWWWGMANSNSNKALARGDRYDEDGAPERCLMHNLLMGKGVDKKTQVVHINGNTLDNRKSNLAVTT
jgi:hypothetical protein